MVAHLPRQQQKAVQQKRLHKILTAQQLRVILLSMGAH